MIKTVKTVGELKAALADVRDDMPLTISVTGYDFESDSIVGIGPAEDGGISIDVMISDNMVKFSNSEDKDLAYSPDF